MNLKSFFESKIKSLRYLIEAVIVKIGIAFFGFLKPETASNLGAKISKFVGPKISVHKLAYKNISNAMPELDEEEKEKILQDMWDNLGRIVGEFPHIASFSPEQFDGFVEETENCSNNIDEIKKSGKGGIIFGAHIGNWEIGPKCFIKNDINISTVYRPLNNPYVEKMTASARGVDLIGKSVEGSRRIIEVIRKGGFVIILADQKISEGEPVKFFHDDAVTTTSIARIALKYNVPLIPARSIRVGNKFKFKADVEKPLEFEKSDNLNEDVLSLTRKINSKLEHWIREYPSQWFWVHNRWKRK